MEKKTIDINSPFAFIIMNWQFFTIIFSLSLALMYHVIELRTTHDIIKTLTESNNKLTMDMDYLRRKVEDIDNKLSTSTKENLSLPIRIDRLENE